MEGARREASRILRRGLSFLARLLQGWAQEDSGSDVGEAERSRGKEAGQGAEEGAGRGEASRTERGTRSLFSGSIAVSGPQGEVKAETPTREGGRSEEGERATESRGPKAGFVPRSLSELVEDLRDASPRVRREAAKELGKRGGPGVEEALGHLLGDDSEEVRKAAVQALRDLGGENAVRILKEALKRGDWGLRAVAARALQDLGWEAEHTDEGAIYLILREEWEGLLKLGKHALQPLISFLQSCPDEHLREKAARTLGLMGDPRAVGALVEALRDIHPRVRKAAAWSLGQTGRRKGVEPLIASLEDPDGEVREEAAEALVRIGTPALQPLVTVLREGSGEQRRRVAEVIGRFYRSPDSKPLANAFLLAMLKEGDPWSRARTAAILGELGQEWAVEPLIEALYFYNVRDAARKALVMIGKPAVPALAAALKHHHIAVRKAAAEVLKEIGDERAVGPLLSALKDKDWEVREAARAALEAVRRKGKGTEDHAGQMVR